MPDLPPPAGLDLRLMRYFTAGPGPARPAGVPPVRSPAATADA